MSMTCVRDRTKITRIAEEVRRLHDHAGEAVVNLSDQIFAGEDVGRQRHDFVSRKPATVRATSP